MIMEEDQNPKQKELCKHHVDLVDNGSESDDKLELMPGSEPPLPLPMQLREHDHSIAKRNMYASID